MPRAWRGSPRSLRRPPRPSPRARSRRDRPRCGGGRVRSCGHDRHGRGRPPWAIRLNLRAMRTHAFLLVNPRSGGASPTPEELAAAARELGVEPRLLRGGEDPHELARSSGAAVLGVAGGEGSLPAVGAAAPAKGPGLVLGALGA